MLARLVLVVSWAAVSVVAGSWTKAQAVQYAALSAGMKEIDALEQEMCASGRCVPRFGRRADAIISAAGATIEASCEGREAVRACAEVAANLDTRLRVLYERQLRAERDRALEEFRHGSASTAEGKVGAEVREFTRMVRAERDFIRRADDASRSTWSYDAALAELRASLHKVADATTAEREATLRAAAKNMNYFTVLKRLVTELDEAIAKRTGADSDLSAGLAFRVPNTNINLSGEMARSKTNVQVSVIPDDSAPLLGRSNINTRRLGAGNLALTAKCELTP